MFQYVHSVNYGDEHGNDLGGHNTRNHMSGNSRTYRSNHNIDHSSHRGILHNNARRDDQHNDDSNNGDHRDEAGIDDGSSNALCSDASYSSDGSSCLHVYANLNAVSLHDAVQLLLVDGDYLMLHC